MKTKPYRKVQEFDEPEALLYAAMIIHRVGLFRVLPSRGLMVFRSCDLRLLVGSI